MIDHDKNVGQLLDLLDKLGIADDTIVMYSTDNGAAHEHLAGRRDDAVPQREEHQLGGRVPRPVDDPLAGQDPRRRRVQRDRPAPRLAADVPRRRRRAGHRREAQAGPRGRRQDVQGAHRRLQPAAVPHRRGGREPAQGLHLLQRRRRPGGAALRQLEDGVHGAASPGNAGGLGRAVHGAARAEALQPAHRPVRAGGHHVEHLLGLVHAQGLHDHGGAGRGRPSSSPRSRSSRRGRRRRASRSTRRWRRWTEAASGPPTDRR